MSDEKMPEQPKTVELDRNGVLIGELKGLLVNGFSAVNHRLDGLEGTDRTLVAEVGRLAMDITDLRAADRRHEDDVRRLSERTKGTDAKASSANLAQDAQLAQERVAREELAAEVKATKADVAATKADVAVIKAVIVDTANDVRKFIATPKVKIAGALLVGAFSTWLASRFGIELPK